jgi:hypothetical protein
LGAISVDRLVAQLEGGTLADERLETELVLRETTAAPQQGQVNVREIAQQLQALARRLSST